MLATVPGTSCITTAWCDVAVAPCLSEEAATFIVMIFTGWEGCFGSSAGLLCVPGRLQSCFALLLESRQADVGAAARALAAVLLAIV